MQIAVIHGPNLNLLGRRQPHIYGSETLIQLEERIGIWAAKLGVEVAFIQSNSEGSLVDSIQNAGTTYDAIVLNPGGYTHTSVAIADAVSSIDIPTVEVHLSDIRAREPWRSVSRVGPAAIKQISGRGAVGYRDAMRHLQNRARARFETIRYGPAEDNVADVLTADKSSSLVVLVHGGLWLGPWERDTMETLAIGLNEVGFNTMNIEYRRIRTAPVWPASGHDVEMAIRYAGTISDDVAVIGHSAGGYLGLWAHRRTPDFRMVGLAPLTDLAAARNDHPSLDAVTAAGAPTMLTAPSESVWLIHGVDDEIVPPWHSERFSKNCKVEVVDGAGHFDLLGSSGSHWNFLVEALG